MRHCIRCKFSKHFAFALAIKTFGIGIRQFTSAFGTEAAAMHVGIFNRIEQIVRKTVFNNGIYKIGSCIRNRRDRKGKTCQNTLLACFHFDKERRITVHSLYLGLFDFIEADRYRLAAVFSVKCIDSILCET